MPSSISHAMVAVAAGSAMAPRPLLKPFLIIGALCAVLPDIDAFGRLYGSGDIEWLGGHRGFTHSIAGAASLALVVTLVTLPSARWRGYRLRLGAFVFIATALHGVLDTLTSIGADTSPVQFFSPFSSRGYTAPWQPIRGEFSELFFCLLPLIAVTLVIWYWRGLPSLRRETAPIRLPLDE